MTGLEALRALGVKVRRVLLVGGGARSQAVQRIAPTVLGAPVTVPSPAEYVAIGAARQAAWALTGTAEPPQWPTETAAILDGVDPAAGSEIRGRYAEARRSLHGV